MNEQEQLLRFQNVVNELIDPERGCPWDKEQTPVSMCEYLIEECHELVDAIRSGKPGHACDEMGDLLFVVLLMARRFELAGQFSLGDALKMGADKMTRRHPHVFGEKHCESMDDLMKNWAAIKKGGKRSRRQRDQRGAFLRTFRTAAAHQSLPSACKSRECRLYLGRRRRSGTSGGSGMAGTSRCQGLGQ